MEVGIVEVGCDTREVGELEGDAPDFGSPAKKERDRVGRMVQIGADGRCSVGYL